ncbi:MAG: hypothetical protein ACXWLR_13260 [Myxococcales bacterium]
MRINLIAGLIAGLGFACASAQTTQAPANLAGKVSDPAGQGGGAVGPEEKAKRKMVCTYETLVGSHIPQKTCRDEDDSAAQRGETQDMIRGLVPKNTHTGG